MARRKDHTRPELARLAIDCARRLVAAGGTSALTARNLAREMDYTPGTLYNVFRNIEGLIVAVNADSLRRLTARLATDFARESDSERRVHRFCRRYLDFQATQPALWQLLFATPLQARALDDPAYRNAVRQIVESLAKALLPFSRTMRAARLDAEIIWHALRGICLRQPAHDDDENHISPQALVERFLDRFLER